MRSARTLGFPVLSLLLLAAIQAAPALSETVRDDAASAAVRPIDPACHPTGGVAEALDEFRKLRSRCGLDPDCTDRGMAILEQALEEHPGDLHLERELQSAWHYAELPEEREARKDEVLARYRAFAEEHPEDPESVYLAARADDDPERAGELYRRAVELDPDFPWPRLGVIFAHRMAGGAPDAELERRHAGAFLDRCPGLVAAVAPHLRAIQEEPFWRDRVAAGREWLLARDLGDWYRELGQSWGVLYSSTPLAEHPSLDPVVREEIARVEALGLEEEDGWWQILGQGYDLVGDEAGAERIEAERIARFPCSDAIGYKRVAAWKEEHPKPEDPAAEEETERWATALWEQSEAWLAECPDAEEYRFTQLQAAMEGAALTDEELASLSDELLAASEDGTLDAGTAVELLIAGMFVEREAYLERVDDLVITGVEKELAELRADLENPAYPDDLKQRLEEYAPHIRWNGFLLRTRAAIAREDADGARDTLAEAASFLEEMRPAEDAADAERQTFLAFQGGLLELSGDLADLQGRHADAAALYARASTMQTEADEVLEKGWEAWAGAGGSAEGWQSLTEGLAGASGAAFDRTALRWKEKELPLPAEFEVADLEGGTWARADFEGKTVFVNLWATWCGPCRQELPEVEKLYERTRERDDVRVVTFNIDSNPGAALRYAEKEGFTFPVLLAGGLVDEMGGANGIPRSWIVDESTVVVREQIGFGEAEGWVDEVLELLERYAAADSD